MARELFDNATSLGTQTTLSQPALSTDTQIHVRSPASSALSQPGGQFRVIIINPQTGAAELALVTNNQWTALWTVQRGIEGTRAQDFPQDSIVKHIFTAGALQIGAGFVFGGEPGQILTVRDDGTVAYSTPMAISARAWGMDPSATSDTNATALQNAIDQAATNAGAGPGAGVPGCRVNIESGTYTIDKSILMYFGVRLYGVSSFETTLKADATVPLANYQGGARPNGSGFAAMMKWNGGDAWAHGVHVVGISFNTNNVAGLGATWFEAQGEQSIFDDLRCSNTVATPRTLTDASLTAGSNVLTFSASTVSEDDVNAILNFGGSVAAPAAPTVAGSGTGGKVTPGRYGVVITYLTANGETAPSAIGYTSSNVVAGQNLVINSPPAVSGATGWFAYVSAAGASGGGRMHRQQAPGAATAIGTNLTISANPSVSGATPYSKIDRINWGTNDSSTSHTSCTMNIPAAATLSNVHVTIMRPTDAFTFDMAAGGAATGRIGILNGTVNSGALLRLKNNGAGPILIDQLSGDDNGGGILRISRGGNSADPVHVTINHMKVESDYYNPNWMFSHDPVILLDRCYTVALNVLGGAFAPTDYARDLIRLDNTFAGTGGSPPSIFLAGIEGQNWFNPQFDNIIHDTGGAIPEDSISSSVLYQNAYPNIMWGRDLIFGSSGHIPKYDRWESGGIYYAAPKWTNPSGYATASQNVNYPGGISWYVNRGAVDDAMAWDDDISPGTYNIGIAGYQAGNNGIVTVEFGVNLVGAPPVPVTQSDAGGTFPSGVNYPVCITYVTKNGETIPSDAAYASSDGTINLRIKSPPKPTDVSADQILGWYAYVGAAGSQSSTATRQQTAGNPTPLGADFVLSAAPTATGAAIPVRDSSGVWTLVGTVDQYGNSLSWGHWTGVVVPKHVGPVRLRFRITGKNASSTSYVMNISARHWQRTA
jgi:hypothetical protein